MADKLVEKKMSLASTIQGWDIMSNALKYNMAKSLFLGVAVGLWILGLGSDNPWPLLIPVTFILIARARYVVNKREAIAEKQTEAISELQEKIFSLTGERVTINQAARLLLDRMVRTDKWFIHLRPTANSEEVELLSVQRQAF